MELQMYVVAGYKIKNIYYFLARHFFGKLQKKVFKKLLK